MKEKDEDSKEVVTWKDILAFIIAILLNLLPMILALVAIFIIFLVIHLLAA